MKTARYSFRSRYSLCLALQSHQEPFKELYDVGLFKSYGVWTRVLSKHFFNQLLVLSGGTMMISVLPMSSIKLKGVLFDLERGRFFGKIPVITSITKTKKMTLRYLWIKGFCMFDRLQERKSAAKRNNWIERLRSYVCSHCNLEILPPHTRQLLPILVAARCNEFVLQIPKISLAFSSVYASKFFRLREEGIMWSFSPAMKTADCAAS